MLTDRAPLVDAPVAEGTRRYQTSPLLGGIELLTADYRRHVFPPHAQDTVVLGLVARGRIEVLSHGRSMVVTEGNVLFIPAGVVHEAHATSDDPWTYRALYLTSAQWKDVCATAGVPVVGRTARVLRDDVIHRSLRALHARLSQSIETEHSCLARLGALAIEVGAEEESERDRSSAKVARELVRVRQVLDADIGRRISLSDMARLAGLSRFHFLRAFARAYGVTPYAYSINRRVMMARRLLIEGRPISMAALEAGFADQAHLTRVFLRTIGVTPGEFRRAFRLPATRQNRRSAVS
jgi:AraC-like DNA-binding protein